MYDRTRWSLLKLGWLFNLRMTLMICTSHARKVGFSIRKSTTRYKSDKSIFKKHIVCSSQGHQQFELSKDTTRLDCTALIQFNVSREGVWTMQKNIDDHNHYLASPDKAKKT
jgi:hypothetical protein